MRNGGWQSGLALGFAILKHIDENSLQTFQEKKKKKKTFLHDIWISLCRLNYSSCLQGEKDVGL